MVNPAMISALIQLGPAAYQMIQGIKQTREGKEMQKNLGARVNYEIPEAAKQALGVMQSLASSREMPGQSNLENKLDLSQAGALGNIAQSGSMSSQDMMAALTNLGGQRMMQEQDIAQSAAQDYQQRQQALSSAYGNFAGYQEAKQADRQKDWYERAEAAAAMRGAGMENTMGAIQGIAGALTSLIPKPSIPPDLPPDVGGERVTQNIEKIESKAAPLLPGIPNPPGLKPVTGLNGKVYNFGPAAGTPTAANINQMLAFQQNPSYAQNSVINQNPSSGAISPLQNMPYLPQQRLMPNGPLVGTAMNNMFNLLNMRY